MDNLELLRKMPDNSVDLIYSDILYATGKDFGDYKDIKYSKEEVYGFYEDRIKEMYRVLAEDGSIYLHMDSRIIHWIRVLLDKYFGFDNFINEIIWTYTKGGRNTKKLKSAHDNIVWYSKSKKYTFNLDDIRVPYSKETLRRQNAESWKKLGIKLHPKGQQRTDVWSIPAVKKGNYTKQNIEYTGYKTQKPEELVRTIIKASSNEGDVVADFFMGSGTTIKAAKELGRKYIGCDINPRAIEITQERLDKLKGNNNT